MYIIPALTYIIPFDLRDRFLKSSPNLKIANLETDSFIGIKYKAAGFVFLVHVDLQPLRRMTPLPCTSCNQVTRLFFFQFFSILCWLQDDFGKPFHAFLTPKLTLQHLISGHIMTFFVTPNCI